MTVATRLRPARLCVYLAAAATVAGCGDSGPDRPPTPSVRTDVTPTTTTAVTPSGGISDIAVLALDGSGTTQITRATDGAGYGTPAWSHDGRRLAVSGPPCDDCTDQIALIDIVGDHAVTALTTRTEGVAGPSWSPDDSHLVYVGGPANTVLASKADGSGEYVLIEDQLQHSKASWSPNGRLVAFTTHPRAGGSIIEVMQPDGSARRRLTPLGQTAEQPAWSPDSQTIAFARQSGSSWTISTVSIGNGRIRDLTDPTQDAQQPAWSPDGRRIAFTAILGGTAGLAVMSSDGANRRALRTSTPNASSPAWSPDGTKIAFTVTHQ